MELLWRSIRRVDEAVPLCQAAPALNVLAERLPAPKHQFIGGANEGGLPSTRVYAGYLYSGLSPDRNRKSKCAMPCALGAPCGGETAGAGAFLASRRSEPSALQGLRFSTTKKMLQGFAEVSRGLRKL